MFSGVGNMANCFTIVHFTRSAKLNEKSSLMAFREWKSSDSIEMMFKKEAFSIVDPIPNDDERSRSFTLNPEFTTPKGWFVIKKKHIICVLAVILTIGIILALHQKSKNNVNTSRSSKSAYFQGIKNENTKMNDTSEKSARQAHDNSVGSRLAGNDFSMRNLAMSPKQAYGKSISGKPAIVNPHMVWNPITEDDKADLSKLKHLIQPFAYNIYIELDNKANKFVIGEQWTFHGNVSIIFRSREEIKYVIIGASDLRISSVHLVSLDDSDYGVNYDISIDQYDADEGTLILHAFQTIRANVKYSLQIVYNGDIQRMPYGLFQITKNITETGHVKTLIATNTNVPFARTIFPCFDLPTQMATYELHICREKSMIATRSYSKLSRTQQNEADTCTWEIFESTPKMPLHFFGFAISDYNFKRIPISKQRTFTVWTPYEGYEEISYALEVGPRLIDILDNYFGIDLPVQNIDVYPVPSVFPYLSSKLGIIIAQESEICIKEYVTSEAEKEHVVKNLAAHLIEQWTGFMNFLDETDNWVKESIVQYLQYIATDKAEPKWKVMQHFFADVHLTEMDTDIINTHKKPLHLKYLSAPRRMNKHAPLFPIKPTSVFSSHTDFSKIVYSNTEDDEIIPDIYSEIFDRKEIDKGICIMKMVHNIVTDQVFKTSIKKFIESSKEGPVNASMFWEILTTEAGNNTLPNTTSLKTIVNEWAYHQKYPILLVVRNYKNNTVTFEQLLDPSNYGDNRHFRFLPITYTTEDEKLFSSSSPQSWMEKSKNSLKAASSIFGSRPYTYYSVPKYDIKKLQSDSWILVNPKQIYLYRVHYDERNWNMLRKGLETGVFPAEVRAQLVDDALFLARRGLLQYDFAMDLAKVTLAQEKEYVVWNSALHHLQYLKNIIDVSTDNNYEDQQFLMEHFIKELITPMYNNINFQGLITKKYHALDQLTPAEHNQLLVESEIYRWACEVGIEECTVRAQMDFGEWKRQRNPKESNTVNPNLRYATLCNAMRAADEPDFDFLYQIYVEMSSMNPNKFIYLKSLYCYNKIVQVLPKILSLTLVYDFSLTHLHEVSNIWQALIENPIASTAPFDYMLMYWKSILKTFGDYTPIMRNIIEGATINIDNEKQLNELITIKDKIIEEKPKIYELLKVAINHVSNRITWKKNQMPGFLTWLKQTRTKVGKRRPIR